MSWRVPALIVGGGVLLRVLWSFTPAGELDGDDTVYGLMGLHILEGRDYPIYFWEGHYAGAIVAYLAAVGYWLFGFGVGVLKSTTLPFVAGYLAVTYALALRLFDRNTAVVALLFAAIQPAIPFAYSVKPVEYPEILCLGGLALWLSFTLPSGSVPVFGLQRRLALLGFLWGFGFYISPLIVPYVVVAAVFLLVHRRDALNRTGAFSLFAGSLIGVSPVIVYNVQYPLATFLRLSSRVLKVSKAEALNPDTNLLTVVQWIARYLSDLPERVLTLMHNLGPLMGLDLSGGSMIAGLILAGAMLALWNSGESSGGSLTGLCVGQWCAWIIPGVMVFAWVFGLDRPRHLVAMYSVLPLGLAALYGRVRDVRSWAGYLFVAALLLVAGMDLIKASAQPRISVALVVEAAGRHGIRGLYADYEIAYRVMFASKETVLASPTAWTYAPGLISDRTPDITRQVDRLPDPAYVFFGDRPEAEWFADGLARRNIAFTRRTLGPFELFTGLSEPIRSSELPVSKGW